MPQFVAIYVNEPWNGEAPCWRVYARPAHRFLEEPFPDAHAARLEAQVLNYAHARGTRTRLWPIRTVKHPVLDS